MFAPVTVQVHSNGTPISVHLLSTGAVAVKTKFRENNYSGFKALLSFLLDFHFTEWLPIYVLVIEHPEGTFVIDAGEIVEVNKKDYFRSSGWIASWFDKSQFKFKISKEEELEQQLKVLNLPKEKIKAIVLTHLHFDHTDGIKYFEGVPVCVSKREWEKPFGDLPKLYPSWFKPQLIELNEQYEMFDKAHYLTAAKDLVLIETPGHTYHHCSVVLKCDEGSIFFAADICYSQQQLINETFPGNNASNKLAKQTYDKVKEYCKHHPVIFIPSHESEAADRLKKLEVYGGK